MKSVIEERKSLFALETRHAVWVLWKAAIHCQASVAVWRFPRRKTIHFLADFSKTISHARLDLQKAPAGFAVSPFLNPEGNESLFLKAQLYFTRSAQAEQLMETAEVPGVFWDLVDQNPFGASPYHLNVRPDTEISGKKDHFIQVVSDGLEAIRAGEFEKVVAARTLDYPLWDGFDVMDQFFRLEETYTEAFVNLVSIPGRGTWMGASPELMVEVDRDQRFRTVSLAGTQPYPLEAPLAEATWNQKEIEEQALVSRYIIDQFKTIRLREFEETGPRTVRAGDMIHLKTEFTVDMKATQFPELGTVMLHLLHPTSAVCGMPKYPALRFIISNEHLKREFYSGFLGPVNLEQVTRLYVNLRCMQILRTRGVLYAGAGITHESVPEREWEETALKCQTLLKVMNGK
jgi:isochorismate synthase